MPDSLLTKEEDVVPVGSPPKDTPPKKDEASQTETDEEPRMFAGKYKSADDLEKAYLSSQEQMGKQGNELGRLKTQLKSMQAEMEKAKTPKEEPPDYSAQEAAIMAQVDVGEITMSEALKMVSNLTREQTLQQAQMDMRNILAEERTNAEIMKFMDDHPDFEEIRMTPEFEQIKRQNPLAANDDLATYWIYQAQLNQLNAANLQAQLAEAQKRLDIGEGEKDSGTLNKPGAGIKDVAVKPKKDGGTLDGALDNLRRIRQSQS